MKNTEKGALIGAGIGTAGTAWTYAQTRLSPISLLPCGILSLFGAGLIYSYPAAEEAINCLFYGGIGALVGHLYK